MRLPKSTQKIKAYLTHNPHVGAVLMSFSTFLLGTALYATWNVWELKTSSNKEFGIMATEDLVIGSSNSRAFVASKKGTVYYLPTCSGAKRIKEVDKIWFASSEEAREGGYRSAKNCKVN